jgi:predicted nucleic acid-binding OB-fold protein
LKNITLLKILKERKKERFESLEKGEDLERKKRTRMC